MSLLVSLADFGSAGLIDRPYAWFIFKGLFVGRLQQGRRTEYPRVVIRSVFGCLLVARFRLRWLSRLQCPSGEK